MAAIACVHVSHFPYVVEAARDPALRGRRVLITRREGTRPVVLDCSLSAEVSTGTPLQTAHARYKDAVLLEADQPLYEEAWNAVLDSLEQRSPVVESAGHGRAYVDLTGLDDLYGSSARTARAVVDAVPAQYGARVGVALGKFPANVAAQQAKPGEVRRTPDDVRGYLAPVSIDLLPVPWEMRDRLHQFGLYRLGDIAARPFGPFQAQFGRDGALAWRLSRGMDDRPVVPRTHDMTITERWDFEEPTTATGTMLLATDVLLERAYRRPELRGRAARAIDINGDVLGTGMWHRRMTARGPYGTKDVARDAVKSALSTLALPGPLTGLAFTLTGLVAAPGKQLSMLTDVRARDQLREAVEQLSAHLGYTAPIYRFQELEPWSRIPERRAVMVPFAP
ncbi:MAG: hypothetical protein EXR47_06010 [Dehalococcoidia bacterium]|nr:hypothetical protein [Dehalococcoidia bacterium]